VKHSACAFIVSLLLAAPVAAQSLDADVRAVASMGGEPALVGAAGLMANEEAILSIENRSAFEPASAIRRIVIVGGPGSGTAESVLNLVRWFKRDASARVRRDWALSALPSWSAKASAEGVATSAERAIDPQLERWITFQVPDVLVEVRDDNQSLGLQTIKSTVIKSTDGPKALENIVAAAPAGPSDLRSQMIGRASRRPIDVAQVLARRYPGTPGISYIPSVAWTNTMKLAQLTGDSTLTAKVRQQTEPWTSGSQPLFADRILLTSVAGTMVFADLGGDARRLAAEGARLAVASKDSGIAEYGQGWTDDMFMSSAILARMGEYDAAATRLTSYAARLQRPDGVFMHATDGPHAWGRGNGFAALGVTELLTVLPENHPARGGLLEIYRRHMAAVRPLQSPDGMWREVLDEPGAYREESATAMLLTAMARGIRLGWIGHDYDATVDRAWLGVLAHVKGDGTVIDVCAGTGSGPTKRYYLDRAAITGADDRGGAMALMAAMEMIALRGR